MKTYTLFFDGSYCHQSGEGGWGAILFSGSVHYTSMATQQKNEVTRHGGFLFHAGSPTVAEAEALLYGIKLAIRHIGDPSHSRLIIHGDCLTVMNALRDEILPVQDPLRKRLSSAISLANRFDSVEVEWVPRKNNAVADHEAGRRSRRSNK